MPQSAELAGGAGHTFEDMVAAQYLAALLAETVAAGIADRRVVRVGLQQRDFGELLDDLIVDFRSGQDEARLSLQLKRSLVISSAASNQDFADVVRDSWGTLQKADFRQDVDRFGAAAETVAVQKRRDLNALCDFARASATLADFEVRFQPSGNASAAHAAIKEDIAGLIAKAKGSAPSPQELFRFLRHFVLLVFDHLHDASTAPSEAIAVLAPTLAAQHTDRAPQLWDRLCKLARAGAGRSQQFVRRDLVANLTPVARLAGAPSLRRDLERLTALAGNSVLDIEGDVGGTQLDRPKARESLAKARDGHRFVQVQGLAGSGKSALLRRAAESAMAEGHVLFLKSDRLQGTSWAAFAAALGLDHVAIEDLLVEVGAAGTPTLFIDGIDRVELAQRPILLDLIRAIVSNPILDRWKLVATLRDTGVEHLRTWLPRELFDAGMVGVVTVEQLDSDEAQILADAQPALRPLLFGPRAVREIVRRPFFAKILAQNFASAAGIAAFMPRSEVDLLENWWLRGGYDAGGQSAIGRRLALLDLAAFRARNPSLPIALTELRADTVPFIDQLVTDGILQAGRDGVSVRFAHDIFFEWAYFHCLSAAGSGWIALLTAIGEPPMVGRIVDLLAQARFAEGDAWAQELSRLEQSGLRSQWLRAWLLGPLGAPTFDEHEARFLTVTTTDEGRLLRRVLVWFQAERTIPNPTILKGELGQSGMTLEKRIQTADLLGWPSDFAAWGRLIGLLLRESAALPVHLRPQITAIFEVWQNALADIPNDISKALLAQAEQWLGSLETRSARQLQSLRSRDREELTDPWSALGSSTKELASDLRRLILRAARAEPDVTRRYLRRLLDDKEPLKDIIDEIFAYAPLLSLTHAVELADITLLHLREELPADAAARVAREEEVARARRTAALAKPPGERSREEQFAADGLFSRIGIDSVSHFDWETLALDDHQPNYFPASPLREPFKSLFENAAAEALRTVRELSNHAMTAWRQLFQLDWQRRATPNPLTIAFPWGEQQFWGASREYLWARGLWAPKALACAWLAAENWALAQLAAGVEPDALIRQIVEGNESIASLALAIVVAREAGAVSDTVQPILESARIWRADIRRGREEISFKSSLLIGFTDESHRPHAKAVDAINKRQVREGDLRDLVGTYVLTSARSDRMREAIRRFAEAPDFELEEFRGDGEVEADLAAFAASMGHWADLGNYHAVKASAGEPPNSVVFLDPDASTPEAETRRADALASLSEQALFVWAEKCLDSGAINEMFDFPRAMTLARRITDGGSIAGDALPDAGSVAWGGVAGVAAVALVLRDVSSAEERTWARGILGQFARPITSTIPGWSSMTLIPWHAGIFAARGIAADMRSVDALPSAVEDLLALAAHPLDMVALAALEGLLGLFATRPRLAWAALGLGFDLCVLPPRRIEQSPEERASAEAERRTAALAGAITAAQSSTDWPVPRVPAAPWTFVPGAQPMRGMRVPVTRQDFDEDVVVPDGAWQPSREIWNSQFAAKILPLIPVPDILAAPGADTALLDFIRRMLAWTIESIAPSWDADGRDSGRGRSDIYDWNAEFPRLLARLAGELDADAVERDLLAPIVALRSDPCFSLLAPFVDWYLRAHVLDAAAVAPSADRVLQISLERLLAWHGFDRKSYRAGELHGFDLPNLVTALMFVAALKAPAASRFANGDWRDIGLILPTVDRFVRGAGWVPTVMSKFLKLCEHARDAYPADQFAAQILAVLSLGDQALAKWHGTMLTARIASLVQRIADEQAPLPADLGQPLLRILDILVDQGDRRSAALQLTEAFREIRLVG